MGSFIVLSGQNYGKAASWQQSCGQARSQFVNDLRETLSVKWQKLTQHCTRILTLCLLAFVGVPSLSWGQAPVFEITPLDSSIKFHVKFTATIAGKFGKWDATLTFMSPEETTGVLEITIQAASVDTGSGMKNRKLKSKDFFDAKQNPLITFKSTKIVQTGPNTYEVDGDFTIRGVSNHEKLTLTISGRGAGSGEIKGAMVFNQKDYGVNSGPPLAFKQ
jgi:polyisoprenoid-binding protein YceI